MLADALEKDFQNLCKAVENEICNHLPRVDSFLFWWDEEKAEVLNLPEGKEYDELLEMPSVLYVDKHGFASNYHVKSITLKDGKAMLTCEDCGEGNGGDEVFELNCLDLGGQIDLLKKIEAEECVVVPIFK